MKKKTKVEAITELIRDNGGKASWSHIYQNIEQYYRKAKRADDWRAGIRGVVYREIRNGRTFEMAGSGIVGLRHNPMKKTIGYCAVDSGQLIIVDPCYLKNWRAGEYRPERRDGNHYEQACDATLGDDMGGEVLVSGSAGTGVATSTGYGDGSYPVIAHYEDGRIRKIEIKFF